MSVATRVKGAPVKALDKVEGVFIACPASGFIFDGKKVRAHKVDIRICRGGKALFIVCNPHKFRGFINDEPILKRCKDAQQTQAPQR